jgi:hypothetical protein
MDKDKEKIRALSAKFREAIVRSDKDKLPVTLYNFPEGACGDASILLGEYLHSMGCGSFQYVVGWRNEQSHAWIEVEDLIIDITSDQFPEKEEPVIVTTDKSWHNQFVEDQRNAAKIDIYDESAKLVLKRALREIVGLM